MGLYWYIILVNMNLLEGYGRKELFLLSLFVVNLIYNNMELSVELYG